MEVEQHNKPASPHPTQHAMSSAQPQKREVEGRRSVENTPSASAHDGEQPQFPGRVGRSVAGAAHSTPSKNSVRCQPETCGDACLVGEGTYASGMF